MRHVLSPKAFTRTRLLPLPKLIAALVSMRSSSVQVGLDAFFGSLGGDGDLQRVVSDRAFAKARDNLSWSGFQRLNTFVVDLADSMGLVPRWRGLRVVAADASDFMPAVRAYTPASGSNKTPAAPSQHLFSLYLPGAELTLLSELHGLRVGERQMLIEALSHLLPGDVLVLDRGYPANWLVAYLNEHSIKFCMRCDKTKTGWRDMRSLLHSGQEEVLAAKLLKPKVQDVSDYELSGKAPELRLVRHITPDGKIWVLATNLPAKEFPVSVFGDLYHTRWRIEEYFKRLKHVQKLESVSGLSQQAVNIDVQAKVLADNLNTLVCMGALQEEDQPDAGKQCNRAYAGNCLQRLMPRLVLGFGCVMALLGKAFDLLGATSFKRRSDRKAARPKNHVKPHPNLAYKA
jgi:hypothetical protein